MHTHTHTHTHTNTHTHKHTHTHTHTHTHEQKKSNWDAPPDAALAAIEPTANNPQLTFKARRIYVGNLPTTPPIDDKQLREFFDQVFPNATGVYIDRQLREFFVQVFPYFKSEIRQPIYVLSYLSTISSSASSLTRCFLMLRVYINNMYICIYVYIYIRVDKQVFPDAMGVH